MYVANISKCSLKVPQCRLVAALLLQNPTPEEWKDGIVSRNILQMRAPGASLTIAAHLRQRLESASRSIQMLVRDGDQTLATQACFAAALKHSRLLLDFADLQLREEVRLFHPALSLRSWDEFFAGCALRDPDVQKWSAPVVAKLGQNVFRMLAEVGLIENTRSKTLQRLALDPDLVAVLEHDEERAVLRALRIYSV